VNYELVHPCLDEGFKRNPFTQDMLWADPDVAEAARRMRAIYEHRNDERKKAEAGAAILRERFAPRAIGEMARQRLTELAQS
jgi:hypothetical protein